MPLDFRDRFTRRGATADHPQVGEVKLVFGSRSMFYRVDPAEADAFLRWARDAFVAEGFTM